MGVFSQRGNRRTVVISTREENGRRVVPSPGFGFKGNMHGSADLVFEEVAHALDSLGRIGNRRKFSMREQPFLRARAQDYNLLRPYERQPGARGATETFAQSFAKYMLGQKDWPQLYKFWDDKFGDGRHVEAYAAARRQGRRPNRNRPRVARRRFRTYRRSA